MARALPSPASLRTGTTTETRGAAPDGGGFALVIDLLRLGPRRAFYGAINARATLLIRSSDGPGSAYTTTTDNTAKPRRRRTNKTRTHKAPNAPTTAPAITSLE